MTTVLLDGRKLPHGSFEGDDRVPGSGGAWVSCTDTAAGRALCWASNGRQDLTGGQVRAAVKPRDSDGINLRQAKQAIESLTNTTIVIPGNWGWTEVSVHLKRKPYIALIAQLWYAEIPRGERFQLAADFGHAVFITHISRTSGIRVWDPLDPNERHHGNWMAPRYIRAGMEELARREGTGPGRLFCGYIPLQPLRS